MESFLIHRREPFEVVFLVLLAISGTTQLISGATPGSINALLPTAFRTVWLGLLVLGCVVALWGIAERNLSKGVFAENAGLFVVSISVALLGSAQLVFAGLQAMISAMFCWSLVAAFELRRRELRRVIRKLSTL